MKVAIADAGYASYDIEREVAASIGAGLDVRQCTTEDEIVDLAGDADGLVVRMQPVTPRVMDGLARCRVIARYGTGYDTVDVAVATERGIVVANVVAFGVHEVAEQAIALLLAGARRIVAHDRLIRAGAWDIAQADPIHRITGSTLGLVGYGRIARAVQAKLAGFEVRTLVYDPFVPPDEVRANGAEPVDLATLLRLSDLISLHAPLTSETRHIIDRAALRLVKPTAVLANTARGGLVDTASVLEALDEGRLAAAGLDVHETEPLPADDPVRSAERAIVLDHAGWYSEESIEALQRGAIEAVAAVLTGRRPASVVNPEVYARLRPAAEDPRP
jgi:D-3-phosphoglycerate dehydrogenase / 2-oxoglutarate reductase